MSEILTPLLTSVNHDAELEDDGRHLGQNELQKPMDYVDHDAKQHLNRKIQQQKKVEQRKKSGRFRNTQSMTPMVPISAIPWQSIEAIEQGSLDKKPSKLEEEHDKDPIEDMADWQQMPPVLLQNHHRQEKPLEMPPKSQAAALSPRSNISGADAEQIDDLSILDEKIQEAPHIEENIIIEEDILDLRPRSRKLSVKQLEELDIVLQEDLEIFKQNSEKEAQ